MNLWCTCSIHGTSRHDRIGAPGGLLGARAHDGTPSENEYERESEAKEHLLALPGAGTLAYSHSGAPDSAVIIFIWFHSLFSRVADASHTPPPPQGTARPAHAPRLGQHPRGSPFAETVAADTLALLQHRRPSGSPATSYNPEPFEPDSKMGAIIVANLSTQPVDVFVSKYSNEQGSDAWISIAPGARSHWDRSGWELVAFKREDTKERHGVYVDENYLIKFYAIGNAKVV
ncbi:hypothetical protein BC628DRAFT_1414127 [Trametes gibbosa]|nr:hypothetical protein BC628DRAFT_1414127 [Trametes gibbosa]